MANGIAEKARVWVNQAGTALARGTQRLLDPHNVESQIVERDLANAPKKGKGPDSWLDDELIKLGDDRYLAAWQGRWAHHRRFYTGAALFKDAYRSTYDPALDRMRAMTPKDEEERLYQKHHPLVRPIVERAAARILGQFPNAYPAPMTDSPEDKLAAQVARSVWANDCRENCFDALLVYIVLGYLTTLNVFVECGWDASAYADVGLPKPDGSIDYYRAQVGAFRMSPVLAIDLYPDPNAVLSRGRGIHGGAYVIKEEYMTVDDIYRQWGVRVNATSNMDGMYGFLEQRLEWAAGDFTRSAQKQKTAARVRTVWEKPSPQFEEGRVWIYSPGDNSKMIHKGYWPYEKKDRFPFVEFKFQENIGSIWGLNLACMLEDCQRGLDKNVTYISTICDWNLPMLLAPKHCGVSPNAFKNPHLGKIIAYEAREGNGEPKYSSPNIPLNEYIAAANWYVAEAERIAGVRDLNGMEAMPQSGYQYELMMMEDQSRLGPAKRMTARGVAECAEWSIALNAQFGASFPRVLGLDDMAIPARALAQGNAAATALTDLKALKRGNTRVVVQPGSGEARLPAAQEEALIEMVKVGVLPPGPSTAEFILNQSTAIRSDAQIDRLIQGLREEAAQEQVAQMQPTNIAAMKAQFDQQKAALEAQASQQEAQVQIAVEQAKAGIAVQQTAAEERIRAATDIAVDHARAQNELITTQAKNASPSMSMSFQIKPGPTGTAAAEKMAGFPAEDDPEEIQAINTPNPATPTAGKKPNGDIDA